MASLNQDFRVSLSFEPLTIADDLPIEIGDIVSLVVGGPDMVVISTCECGTVEVAWVDSDGDVVTDVFPEEALV